MPKKVPEDPAFGNTKQRPEINKKKQVSPAKKWCFTLNNWKDEEYNSILKVLEDPELIDKYVVGKEVGEGGTPHLQGYIEFTKKRRPFEIFQIKRIHWETAKGSREQNGNYCSKDGNYIANFYIKKPLKLLKEDQLYDWQKNIIDIIKSIPDDRTINWFWEPNGGIGKTTFCKLLCAKYNACIIEGKKNDILYCAAEHESDIYIFDFERSMEEYISYSAIEKVKNGLYMCSKYESKPIVRNSPHIIIFANFPPDKSKLSQDRWNIVRL